MNNETIKSEAGAKSAWVRPEVRTIAAGSAESRQANVNDNGGVNQQSS